MVSWMSAPVAVTFIWFFWQHLSSSARRRSLTHFSPHFWPLCGTVTGAKDGSGSPDPKSSSVVSNGSGVASNVIGSTASAVVGMFGPCSVWAKAFWPNKKTSEVATPCKSLMCQRLSVCVRPVRSQLHEWMLIYTLKTDKLRPFEIVLNQCLKQFNCIVSHWKHENFTG